MRSVFISIALIASGMSAFAQSTMDNCNLFKNIRFKNGRDTIVVKAILRDFLQAPPRVIMKSGHRPAIYKYQFSDYIAFQPENCDKKYMVPLLYSAAIKEPFTNDTKLGITIYATCIVFNEDYLKDQQYDCLVISVTRAK
ncbi:MAG: hypothetical protein JSU01_16535 [Bacteroidetes bacterium]|nr:hypothetical protein [Bacteroidota bacterium]